MPVQGLVVEGPVGQVLLRPGPDQGRGAAVQVGAAGVQDHRRRAPARQGAREARPASGRPRALQKGPRVLSERR